MWAIERVQTFLHLELVHDVDVRVDVDALAIERVQTCLLLSECMIECIVDIC